MTIASIVDGEALLSVLWVSTLAGIAVPSAFGLTILGTIRANEARRAGRPAAATAFGALAVTALTLVLLSVVLGIVVLTG